MTRPGGAPIEVFHDQASGAAFIPVNRVVLLLDGLAMTVEDRAGGDPNMNSCAAYLRRQSDRLAEQAALARIEGDLWPSPADEPPHRRGVWDPRTWFTRRR